ncbi:MAG: energy transducer TonB [Bacteroidetes bacterium]|jgi:TonB family protein|nr:energy transducer TonB [Bacteroidota bacterium]
MSNKEQLEQQRLNQEKRNQRQAAALSGLLFVGVVVLCFFLTAFTIQDPPPGEQFVAVGFADLGSTEQAGGTTESDAPSEVIQEAIEEEVAASESEPEVVQTTEQVVTQTESEVSVQSDPDPDPDPDPIPDPERVDKTAHLWQQQGNPSAGGGGSQGSSEGTGNEGQETGQIDGRGVVSGDWGDAHLNGGTMLGKPVLTERPRLEGVVRINIVVDGSGKVVSVRFDGGANSTVTDSYHIELAKKAAQSATFTADPTKPRRTGYITIRFDLE